MKRILFGATFIVLICSAFSLSAVEVENSLQFRVGAFFPQSHLFREIYDKAGPCYELEANVKIRNNYSFWANVDWFSKDGHSLGLHNRTRIRIVNLGLGGKYFFKSCCFSGITPYVGLGACIGGVWIRNHSHFVDDASKAIFGLIGKTGLYYSICGRYFIDAFVDYLYEPVRFHHHRRELGGLRTGLGIGTFF